MKECQDRLCDLLIPHNHQSYDGPSSDLLNGILLLEVTWTAFTMHRNTSSCEDLLYCMDDPRLPEKILRSIMIFSFVSNAKRVLPANKATMTLFFYTDGAKNISLCKYL